MRSTMVMGTIVNELNSHFELTYFRTLRVGVKKVHTKRVGLRVTKTFSGCIEV